MAIRVVCPQCAKVLSAPDIAAGKRARCSGCQAVMTVPTPAPQKAAVANDGYSLADPAPRRAPAPASRQTAAATPAPARSESKFTWRAAVMWGLASGVGFGVAEGIMYSSRYYNGIQSGEIYVIRYVSCVALHAVWSASVALLIWNKASDFQSDSDWPDLVFEVLMVLAIPMVLHGLYDTMLKKDMDLWALVTAVASFVFLTVLVEYTRHHHESPEPRGANRVYAQ
ncbi:MAG TPA: PrsW family glutamic-type intramembrane protease [Pirellulales bacterium]|nr:PrsW family glutamic-type intramembrane protease [Pirellulales bacterium]